MPCCFVGDTTCVGLALPERTIKLWGKVFVWSKTEHSVESTLMARSFDHPHWGMLNFTEKSDCMHLNERVEKVAGLSPMRASSVDNGSEFTSMSKTSECKSILELDLGTVDLVIKSCFIFCKVMDYMCFFILIIYCTVSMFEISICLFSLDVVKSLNPGLQLLGRTSKHLTQAQSEVRGALEEHVLRVAIWGSFDGKDIV